LELNPQYADAWYNKGIALDKLGRTKEAEKAFERAYELDPALKRPQTSGFDFVTGMFMVFEAGYLLRRR